LSNFFTRVYQLVRKIPKGSVTTYGHLARALNTRDARRVGHALHANPNPTTPCHRVVDRNGHLAPNYAFGGSLEQYAKLVEEGVPFCDREHVNLSHALWIPPSLKSGTEPLS